MSTNTFDNLNYGMCRAFQDLNKNKSHIMSDTFPSTFPSTFFNTSTMRTESKIIKNTTDDDMNTNMDFDTNMNTNVGMDTDIDIEKLVKTFKKTHFDTNECLICKVKSNNIIARCYKGCRYVCHDKCLDSWIKYKKYDSFCIECNTKFSSDVVDNVLKYNHQYPHNPFSQDFVSMYPPHVFSNQFR